MTAAAPLPLHSMTGFGRGAREADGIAVRVEARSVNARHLKVGCRAPAEFDARHADIEALVRTRFERGTVSVSISVERRRAAAPAAIDAAVLADYVAQARAAAARAGIAGEPTLDTLLRLPGVLSDPGERALADADWELAAAAIGAALDDLGEMRRREGAALAGVLRAGADEIDRLAARVRARVPVALAEHRERMRERLAALLEPGHDVPAELLAREVAVLAERSDVAEELERLASHVAQWRDALDAGGPVGRRLEFLSQELGREANTIGSKTADAEIRDAVIGMKLAVDRLKEQSANLE